MLLGGSAAAADDIEPAAIDEALELLGEGRRSFLIASLLVRQAGVRIAGDEAVRQRLQRADVVGHELGAGGAVQAQRKHVDVIERGPQRLDVLPGEHRAHGLDGHGDHHRNRLAEFAAQIVDGQHAGLDVARVLAGFEQQQVGAAFDQPARLLVESCCEAARR